MKKVAILRELQWAACSIKSCQGRGFLAKIRCNLNSAVLNSKLGLVGHCGWELGKDFLKLALQEQEAESKD